MIPNCGMIYPIFFKKRQILQTLRGFYIHGQGQILITLSALMYEPHLILCTNQIFLSGILFVPHIESLFYTLAYMFIVVLPWASRSVDSGDSLYSIAGLAHGKLVLCGWVRLVVPFGFGWPGGLPDVLRLHVSHVRVTREHAHFSLAVQSRSIGVAIGVSRSRSDDGSCPASILCTRVCVCVVTIYLYCIYLQ